MMEVSSFLVRSTSYFFGEDIAPAFLIKCQDSKTHASFNREMLFLPADRPNKPRKLRTLRIWAVLTVGATGTANDQGDTHQVCSVMLYATVKDRSTTPPRTLPASPPDYKLNVISPVNVAFTPVDGKGWSISLAEATEVHYQIISADDGYVWSDKTEYLSAANCPAGHSPPPRPPPPDKSVAVVVVRPPPPPPPPVDDGPGLFSRFLSYCFSEDFVDHAEFFAALEYREAPGVPFNFYGSSLGAFWENRFLVVGGRGVLAANIGDDIAWYGELSGEIAFSPHAGEGGWFAPFVGLSGSVWGETGEMGSADANGNSGRGIQWIAGARLHGSSATFVFGVGDRLGGDGLFMISLGVSGH